MASPRGHAWILPTGGRDGGRGRGRGRGRGEGEKEGNNVTSPPLSASSSSRRTQAVDVFSLGCVFYTVLVPGAHPFGEWYERERNILAGKRDLRGLEGSPDALHLVQAMIEADPRRRPTARMVLHHPFFWDVARRLAFLVDFSDRIEQEPAGSLLALALEAGAGEVVGRAWDVRLDRGLLEDVNKYRKYDTASVVSGRGRKGGREGGREGGWDGGLSFVV